MLEPDQPETPTAGVFAPLAGVRVLEWCGEAAGPFAGKLLGALGADVLKVEPPQVGDSSRHAGPFLNDVPDIETSAMYLAFNGGKKSITLDPSKVEGRGLLIRLILEWADVFLEDRQPEVMEEILFSYGALSRIKPTLVMASVTPFGQTGPCRNFKMYPSQSSHAGGAAYLQPSGQLYAGQPEIPPIQYPGFVSECSAGTQAAVAVLAALWERLSSGEGQHIDLSKQETQMYPVKAALDAYRNEGVLAMRVNVPNPASASRGAAISGTMQCADGYVSLWPLEPYMPQNLADWFGHPEWTAAPDFRQKIQQELMRHCKADLYHGLQASRVAIGSVNTAEEVLVSEQFRARDFFRSISQPGVGDLPAPVLPFKMQGSSSGVPGPVPRLGEHNEVIFEQILGLARQKIERLGGQGVI